MNMEFGSNTTSRYADENSYTEYSFTGVPLWAEIGDYLIPVLGIPGNILTLVVLFSNINLRNKPVNMFIIHQSFIDLIVCIISILEKIVLDFNLNGQVICHLLRTKVSSQMTMYVSSYNMTALTIERHSAIIDPLHYDPDKVKKRLPYIFILLWIFCIVALGVIPVSTIYDNSTCYIDARLEGTFVNEIGYLSLILLCIILSSRFGIIINQ